MLPWLRIFLVHLWVACVAGAALTAGLAMGHIGLATFVWAGVAGLVLGIPAGLLNWVWLRPNRSRRIGWTWPIAERIRRAA